MRILHSSDWHLGKTLFGRSRLEEQGLFLHWLVTLIEEQSIEALCIAGDIFDGPRPSNETLDLYYDFLAKCPCPIHMISGNHDSSDFLKAPRKILETHNTYIKTGFPEVEDSLTQLAKDVYLVSLPYFRTHEILKWKKEEPDALKILEEYLREVKKLIPENSKSFLMAHHGVGPFQSSGSELHVALSGVSHLPLEIFQDYDHVLLGHIHEYHWFEKEKTSFCYPGSPVPWKFSESSQKYVQLIDSDNLNFSKIEIPIFRSLKEVNLSSENWKQEWAKAVMDCSSKDFSHKLPTYYFIHFEMNQAKSPPHTDELQEILDSLGVKGEILQWKFKSSKTQTQGTNFTAAKIGLDEYFSDYFDKVYPQSKCDPLIINEFKQLQIAAERFLLDNEIPQTLH